MRILFRIIAWLLAAAVTFATLGPARLRPHSHLGQNGEHTLAFVLVGLAFGLAYTGNRLRTLVGICRGGRRGLGDEATWLDHVCFLTRQPFARRPVRFSPSCCAIRLARSGRRFT